MLAINDLIHTVADAFDLDPAEEGALGDRYAAFLRGAAGGARQRPGPVLDALWHEHILHTRRYRDDCLALCGAFVDHEPSGATPELIVERRGDASFVARRMSECGAQGPVD